MSGKKKCLCGRLNWSGNYRIKVQLGCISVQLHSGISGRVRLPNLSTTAIPAALNRKKKKCCLHLCIRIPIFCTLCNTNCCSILKLWNARYYTVLYCYYTFNPRDSFFLSWNLLSCDWVLMKQMPAGVFFYLVSSQVHRINLWKEEVWYLSSFPWCPEVLSGCV